MAIIKKEQVFVCIPYMNVLYVSSCKSVDMRIDIVKNEQVKARGWPDFLKHLYKHVLIIIMLSFSSSRYF